VVVRRNWATQQARVHIITGGEGGTGAPAMTQSPKPSGSGIYDIPLATLKGETDGTITVTDDREYCTFSTTMTNVRTQMTTTNFADDSIGFDQRATREKVFFLGGGDLQPNVAGGYISYRPSQVPVFTQLTQYAAPTWGGGAADEEAWRATGTGGAYGVYASFCLPGDLVNQTSISTYVWWVNNALVAGGSAYLYSLYHCYELWYGVKYQPYWISNVTGTAISTAGAASRVYRTAGAIIRPQFTGESLYRLKHKPIHYYAALYNTAGADDISIMGIEFRYTGYT
jgi:hypothetical protein